LDACKGITINKITTAFSLYANITHEELVETSTIHKIKREKEEERKKKHIATMFNHSQQLDPHHHQIQHLDYRRGSPKETMLKFHRCPIKDCRFLPKRNSLDIQ
jgi:hypothetical protein